MSKDEKHILPAGDFQKLLDLLSKRGYQSIGPVARYDAIVYDRISSVDDLAVGWTDLHEAGKYRAKKSSGPLLFGPIVGQQSWKRYLYPSVKKLFSLKKGKDGFEVEQSSDEPPKYAFVGVRSCDLHAISIQDKIFIDGPYQEIPYKRQRENVLTIVVNCTTPGGTCFCSSMNTGPWAESGFDLAMTEIFEDDQHYFVVKADSDTGREIISDLSLAKAPPEKVEIANRALKEAVNRMGRKLETHGIKELLYRNFENPRWKEVADRCLSCANCTLVCPTCFCATIEDQTDLDGKTALRVRKLDSCFTLDHSYIYGGSVRVSAASRYRQWLTHKLASWIDQFGMSGCVGCGRCITWCPVGIDITEEAAAIRESEREDKIPVEK